MVVFAGLTVIQNGYWRSEHTLWRHAVTVNPGSTWVQETVGLSYLLTGDYDRAAAHAREALRIDRFNTRAYLTLAKAEERRGNLAEAAQNYEMFAMFGAMEYPDEAAQIRLYLPALRQRLALQKRHQ
jgi:predicted Zn-dependent protease